MTSTTQHQPQATKCRGHEFLSCTCGSHLGKVASVEQAKARFDQHLVEAGTAELQQLFASR